MIIFKSRPLLFISLFIVVSDILFVAINHSATLESLRADTRKWGEQQQRIFDLIVEEKATTMQQIATYVATDTMVQQLFLRAKQILTAEKRDYADPLIQKIRKTLYDTVRSGWSKMTSAYDVRQLHFHLGPGSTSFLRVHKPEKFGDNMDEVRYTIVDANRTQKPTMGFETGRVYSGIRGVVPFFAENRSGENIHVGALEAGTSFTGAAKLLQKESESDIAVLLTRSHVTRNMWPGFINSHFTDEIAMDGFFIEHSTTDSAKAFLSTTAVSNLIEQAPQSVIVHADNTWQVCTFPLRDYRGLRDKSLPAAGTIVIWKDASKKWSMVRKSFHTNIIFAIIALVFLEVLLVVSWHFSQRHLNATISRQTKELEKIANYDSLTEIFNRRAIDILLHREITRAERYGSLLSVMLIDLDNFKKINDTFGHSVGDRVLQKTALLIQETIRKSDFAGRWGGEEFLVIIPETQLDSGIHLAERIRNNLAINAFKEAGKVTLSIGVGKYEKGETIDELIKRVDDALYKAKRKGRNRVEASM